MVKAISKFPHFTATTLCYQKKTIFSVLTAYKKGLSLKALPIPIFSDNVAELSGLKYNLNV